MKIIVSLVLAFVLSAFAYSQDYIIKKNGEKLNCKITDVDNQNIYILFNKNGNTVNSFVSRDNVQSYEYGAKVVADSSTIKEEQLTLNPFSIELMVGANGGFSEFKTGLVTSGNEDIKIAGGSGGPLNLGIGYQINKRLQIVGSFEVISGSPNISNATVSMDRIVYQASAKYKFNSTQKKGWYVGLGCNYMTNITLDIDATKIKDGGHLICNYKNSFSPLIQLTYHYNLNKRVGFIFDLPLQFNSFKLDKVSVNGSDVALETLKPDFMSNYSNINATSMGFWVGVIIHI